MYWREEGDFVLPKTKQNAMKIPALTMQQQKQQIESEERNANILLLFCSLFYSWKFQRIARPTDFSLMRLYGRAGVCVCACLWVECISVCVYIYGTMHSA